MLLSLHLFSIPGDAGEKGDKGDRGEDGVGIKGSPGAPGAPGEATSCSVGGGRKHCATRVVVCVDMLTDGGHLCHNGHENV